MLEAELLIIKHVQECNFSSDMELVRAGKKLRCDGPLAKLMPTLNNGLLTVGGRVPHVDIDEICKHPYILPYTYPVATLIIRNQHKVAHLGREWVLGSVRRRFWNIKARRIVNRVSHKCLVCKRNVCITEQHKMADLPPERLDWHHPPFYNVGLHSFGPFNVVHGPGNVKTYVCIFTCMSSRAMHFEMLHSLNADAFVNSIRRFNSSWSSRQDIFR